MIRILIADDHAIVRKGLKQIVADTSDMKVDVATNGNEVFEKVVEYRKENENITDEPMGN